MPDRVSPTGLRASGLLCGFCAVVLSHAAEPQQHWLQGPCALLQATDYARVLPAPSDDLQAESSLDRRNSEWMISVFGLEPLDADGARMLAVELAQRIGRDAAAP